MDAWYFLTQAKRLVKSAEQSPHPDRIEGVHADSRSAISRAYYAAFLAAVKLVEDLGFEVGESGQAHTAVRRALDKSGHGELVKAGTGLDTLGEERRKADYRFDETEVNEPEHASAMVSLADRTYQRIAVFHNGVTSGALRSQAGHVVNNIANWIKSDKPSGIKKK